MIRNLKKNILMVYLRAVTVYEQASKIKERESRDMSVEIIITATTDRARPSTRYESGPVRIASVYSLRRPGLPIASAIRQNKCQFPKTVHERRHRTQFQMLTSTYR